MVAQVIFPRDPNNFPKEIRSTSRTVKDRTQGGSHMKHFLRIVAIALLAVVGYSTLRAQSNPLVGTWQLNTTKSKYDPGPTPKNLTRTVVADGDGVKYTFEGVAADGKPIAYSFSVQFQAAQTPFPPSAQTPTTLWPPLRRATK
jgi:hypothetical protein